MHKLKSTVILLLALSMVFSCNAQAPQTTQTTRTTTPPAPEEYVYPETALFEKPETNEAFLTIKNRYTDEELNEINYFGGTIEELNAKYPIEHRRMDEDGSSSITYLGINQKVAVISFDETGKRNLAKGFAVHNFSFSSVSEFAKIKKGDTLEQVEVFDPNGTYLLKILNATSPHISAHYTSDGFRVTIFYEYLEGVIAMGERFIVESIQITPI